MRSTLLTSLLFSFGLLLSYQAVAQNGNNWIDYSKPHWKFKVVETGLYSLSKAELEQAGFPVETVNPRAIRIFGRGKEVPLYFPGENDEVFEDGESISFYAKGNDGWLDREIYDEPEHQTNPHYSLFTDTAAYFITYADAPIGLRMAESSENNFDDFEAHPWLWTESLAQYNSEYLAGVQDEFGISLPFYQEGEGWVDNRFPKGGSRHTDLNTPFAYQLPDAPEVSVRAVSASASIANTGFFNHHLQVGYGNTFQELIDTVYFGYQLNDFQFGIPASALGPTTRVTHRSIDDLNVATDFHSVSWVSLEYPRLPQTMQLPFAFRAEDIFGNGNAYVNISSDLQPTAIFRISSQGYATERIEVFPNGSQFRAILSIPADEEEFFLLGDENLAGNILDLAPVSNNGLFTDHTLQAMDSAFVIITHRSLMNEAQNYALYRESQGMEVLLVDVDELYDQYAFGVAKHPVAIRNFCKELVETWPVKPSHLFLLGKSIRGPSISNVPGSRKSEELFHQNLVPTWGYPSGDPVFTSGITGTGLTPSIPTGRLAAKNGEEVLDYLNKVIEHEQQEPQTWMKRILHFGGGSSTFEQELFANYLADYKVLAEDTLFGADVHTFLKTNSDPIQINLSDSIQYLIEDGTALMTFFGHATSTGFDQNIDTPGSYNNQGKYPFLIGNSCYTGNIHLPTSSSTSENFVLFPNGGMIGFLAKGDLGSPYYLDQYTFKFYEAFCKTTYGSSVGQCMQQSIQFLAGNGGNLYEENTAFTIGLHGDPAITLYPHEGPDYAVKPEWISFDPPRVTADIDSFDVVVDVFNLGKAISEPLSVSVIRELPGGETENLLQEVDELLFNESFRFRFPVDKQNGIGLNSFDVLVDLPENLIPELDDISNNSVSGKELLITSGDLIPAYPGRYEVVPNNAVTLKASTGNPFESTSTYILQLDSNAQFNSPFFQETQISQSGGVIEWSPQLLSADSTVYFWRTAGIPDPGEEYNWRSSSFQVISGKNGWGQAHPDQFRENALFGADWEQSEIIYPETELDFSCKVYGNASTSFESLDTHYQIDLEVQDYSGCGLQPAIHVAVLDSITLRPWETNYNDLHPEWDFGNLMTCTNSRQRPEKYFIFRQNNEEQMLGLQNMLENAVPEGNYLLVYTWQYVNYDAWDEHAPGLYNTFTDLGAEMIGSAQDSVPFIFFQKLGDPSTRIELYGSSIDDILDLETTITGAIGRSSMSSTVINGSNGWTELSWSFLGDANGDSTRLSVVGLNNQLQGSTLNSFVQPSGDWNDLDTQINEAIYPKIRLEVELLDTLNQSAPQPDRWHLLHEALPEAALNPSSYFYLSSDTVKEGEILEFAVSIENISETPMDSLLVHYWIEGSDQERMDISYPRQGPIAPGEALIDTIEVSTFGLQGNNQLWVELNPSPQNDQNYDQPEQSHFNNIGQLSFYVINDVIDPVLDVTFDGRHLMDGELVSGRPEILITLDDENEFFLLNEEADTSNFKLYISPPNGEAQAVYFLSNQQLGRMEWYPAGGSDNKFSIHYSPDLMENGRYKLLVQATDKSGNESGITDYEINFEVDNEAGITEVLNYPNPFSTRTQFVFTLSGRQVPDYIKIQILTVSGRVVREIDQYELGPLRIGRNLTSYWWDGRDEFGDPLANGVYLYRVIAKLNGEELKINGTSAGQYFKEGYGKMYLIR